MTAKKSQTGFDRFLVCGLGELGQHCVVALKDFGVNVIAIESAPPQNWEIDDLPHVLNDLIVGDCRQKTILAQAKIEQCRAALLVTSNERVNIETALAIRQLNPKTRLVIRSTKENLNRLLSDRLGNFVAFDPIQLPANAFAFAALGSETLSFFNLDGQWLHAIAREITPHSRWCNTRYLHELNSRKRRILYHTHKGDRFSDAFYDWEPDKIIQDKDTLVYVETAEELILRGERTEQTLPGKQSRLQTAFIRFFERFKQRFARFWRLNLQRQIRRVAFVCAIAVLGLLVVGTFLFQQHDPSMTLLNAFSTTVILLLGGYGDVFADLESSGIIPWWLQVFSLGLNLAGTAFIGVLYALLTEALLTSQFQFTKRRPPIPQQNHIVIIGLGKVGRRVTAILQSLKQSLVGITLSSDFEAANPSEIPLLAGNLKESLAKANLADAKSAVVITDDEILNLEVALMARAIDPDCHLVIRTSSQHLREHLSQLLPDAQVLDIHAVVAEVFVASAFGERIVDLFRLRDRTILVVEYKIEPGDTLNGLLLSEFACGYGATAILHQKPASESTLMPSEDIRLATSDRLVVLATIDTVQRIEQGAIDLSAKCWQVRIDRAISSDAAFEGANAIARISGCNLAQARDLMAMLPRTVPVSLYKHQAQRLVRELNKLLVIACVVP